MPLSYRKQGSATNMHPDIAQIPNNDEQSKAPQTPAVRLTRRQLAKLEEEEALSKSQRAPPPQPEEVVEDAAGEPVKRVEVAVEQKGDVVTEGSETLVVPEEPTNLEPEPAPKPVRLTRRQQAKLEEELKLSQAEQQTPQPEPTEEEVLEEIVAEAQAEAVPQQEEEVSESANNDVNDVQDDIALVAVAEEQSISQKEVTAEPQEDEEEHKTEVPEAVEVEYIPKETVEARPAIPSEAEFEADLDIQPQDPGRDEGTPSVEITSEAEPKMLSAEKPFEASVSTPVKNQGSTRRTSRSPSKSPMRIEESISAIDRLEEDLESIGKAIPDFEHSDDEKSPRKSMEPTASPIARGKTPSKTSARTPAKAPARTPAKVASKTPSKTPFKAPVATRAPVAAKAPLPIRISRVPSAAPKSVKPTTTSLARASSVRTAPSKDVRKPSTETADYLASKRRPISLSFPTPPPPPKGKAPTKPTFQLSSDNVAAKLKAQKEERLKREAEGAAAPKQRPISMPPPPKSTKPPTVPSFQLPGEATAARLKAQKEERLKRMEEAERTEKPTTRPISMPPPPKSKQLTKPSFQLPGEATAARLKAQKEERLKRMEEAEAAKKAALAAPVRKPIARRPRESLLVRDAPGVSIPPPSKVEAPQRSTSLVSKRSSVIEPSASRSTSTSSANRNSILLAAGSKSTVTPVDAAALKVKGKQVFNRDRIQKEAMERERKEKEEAAKKARAEAAERGRIASREWAERQRKKMMGQ
ncbi:hypothetical protein BU25DRAFT_118049 [Macroventuria anomochaeta]|uniref:Uncharacterized protein n=1 Tax=Macroventuria anomochaeta TaxID=301207 RepID=A0ACB6RV42_9PLEO|nr:uncharacterized protein BU25DRAFT_118049 [Macroventuria anomochaeta]KAF2625285.1 hypothetical protein BU25DRAFT_118049 [Macroventuria anomochaeta]